MAGQRLPKRTEDETERTDGRLPVIRTLRLIIFMLFVTALCICLYVYRDELNMDNFRRILNYIDLGAAAAPPSETGASAPLEKGLKNTVAAFRQGFAVLNCDTLRVLNGAGKEDLAVQLAYQNPALSVTEKLILAYDRGGSGYCVANHYAVLKNERMKNPILFAAMGENGSFALVTDDPGYRAAVSLFDAKQNEIYKWSTSSYYVAQICVSPDGKQFAVSCLLEEDGAFQSKLLAFRADQDDPVFSVSLNGEYPLKISYIDGNTLCAVTEMGVRLFAAENGEPIAEIMRDEPLLACVAEPGSLPLIVTEDRLTGGVLLQIVEADGKTYERAFPESIRYLSAAGSSVAVMAGEQVYLLNRRLEDAAEPFRLSGVRGLAAMGSGDVAVIFSGEVAIYGG